MVGLLNIHKDQTANGVDTQILLDIRRSKAYNNIPHTSSGNSPLMRSPDRTSFRFNVRAHLEAAGPSPESHQAALHQWHNASENAGIP